MARSEANELDISGLAAVIAECAVAARFVASLARPSDPRVGYRDRNHPFDIQAAWVLAMDLKLIAPRYTLGRA